MESGLGREREAAQQWRGPSSRDLTVDTGMGALSLSPSLSLSLQNAATFSAFSTSVFCNSRFRFERAHCQSPLINQNWHFND